MYHSENLAAPALRRTPLRGQKMINVAGFEPPGTYVRSPLSGVLQLQLPQETKKCIITDLSSSNRSS